MTSVAESGSGSEHTAGPPAVRLTGITKRFPGVVANSDINISVRRGTVHALVGENGAGKSTLMKTLYGMHQPDEGTIEVDGRELVFHTPADAIAAGIGMVHQHFMLADNLTVWENVVLGDEPVAGVILDVKSARRRIRELGDRYGLQVDPDELVEYLGVGARQRVEILKVLFRGARILILDEPTAVLVPQEVDELFDNLRELKAEGLTIVFISHKLDEVRTISDEITVIRRGTTVGTADPRTVTNRQLAEMMVGSELPVPELRESTVTDRAVLQLSAVTVTDTQSRPVLTGIDLTIHAGEVLGIAGVEGNGQAELVDTIMGIRSPSAGAIYLDGTDITRTSTLRRRESGIGFIPEDRHRQGLMLEGTLWENRMLGHQTRPPSSRGPLLDRAGARADTRRIVDAFDVRTPGIEVAASSLSGGNQQKLIVGREMSGDPVLLIAAHPTRGVDVGAQAAIWEHLRNARAAGLAVLLISADLEELIGMSDTLTVILRGRLVGRYDPREVTPETLGAAMTGADDARGGGVMGGTSSRRFLLAAAAPVGALLVSFIITSLVLLVTGHNPFDAYSAMVHAFDEPRVLINTINVAATYYLAAVAVAVGFKMNLFNIGVDGQYRLAALLSAAVAGAAFMSSLPGFLRIIITLLVAMAVGAAWAGIAALLKVTRGVSEVISTIMLNAIATALIAYLLNPARLAIVQGNNVATRRITEGGQLPNIMIGENALYSTIFVALLVGVIYWFVLSRTVFGFQIKATGMSESAAVASGISVKRMVLAAMLISGAVAGLIGMPELLNGDAASYSLNFPGGIGFIGIAIALLGRNHPLGMVFSALLWAALDSSSNALQGAEVPRELVTIIQGVILFAVVIAYELVRRYRITIEQRDVAKALAAISTPGVAA